MPISVDHPILLGVIALTLSPVLLPLARWFFEDIETFLNDVGYRAQDDIWWKFIRIDWNSMFMWTKIVGFIGAYIVLVGLSYLSIERAMS